MGGDGTDERRPRPRSRASASHRVCVTLTPARPRRCAFVAGANMRVRSHGVATRSILPHPQSTTRPYMHAHTMSWGRAPVRGAFGARLAHSPRLSLGVGDVHCQKNHELGGAHLLAYVRACVSSVLPDGARAWMGLFCAGAAWRGVTITGAAITPAWTCAQAPRRPPSQAARLHRPSRRGGALCCRMPRICMPPPCISSALISSATLFDCKHDETSHSARKDDTKDNADDRADVNAV